MDTLAIIALGLMNLSGTLALVIRDMHKNKAREGQAPKIVYSDCFTDDDRTAARATASNVKALCKVANIQPVE